MYTTRKYQFITVILCLAILAGVIYFGVKKKDAGTLSGVNVSHEYQATTTAMMGGALIKTAELNQTVASSTYGTVILGSVVVASTTDAALNIYNATSSNAVADGAYSTLVTRFASSTPRGTYVFDAILSRGLVVQLQAGFEGDYVFTWRK